MSLGMDNLFERCPPGESTITCELSGPAVGLYARDYTRNLFEVPDLGDPERLPGSYGGFEDAWWYAFRAPVIGKLVLRVRNLRNEPSTFEARVMAAHSRWRERR